MDRKIKEERRTVYFQIAINQHARFQIWLIFTISYAYFNKSYQIRFCMYLYLLLLFMTLFVYQFIHPCEVNKGTVCFFASVSSFFPLSVSFSLLFYLHWEIWLQHHIYFQEPSKISIITNLVKLLQMIWSYVN